MVGRAKTYGKKKGYDLTDAFKTLQLSPSTNKQTVRSALAPLSSNLSGKQPNNVDKTDDDVAPHPAKAAGKKPVERECPSCIRPQYNPDIEITALTSLESVEPEIKDLREHCEYIEAHFKVAKVAQGSYATVLRMDLRASPGLYTIWKLMPLRPKKGRGSRRSDQTFIADAAAEMKALALMRDVPGFVDCRSAHVLRGSFPELLQDLNQDWVKTHPEDESDLGFHADQLWLLIEMSDAGTDLETLLKQGFPNGKLLNSTAESGKRLDIRQAWDIFWGVAEALACGEEWAKFEHRDLHPGNICITNEPSDELNEHKVKRHTSLQVTLIDYTLSRATMNGDEVLANSMSDKTLFEQTSNDEIDQRQFETYRQMRILVRGLDQTSRKDSEKWKQSMPITNILWLYHVLKLLLTDTDVYERDSSKGNQVKAYIRPKDRKLAKILGATMTHLDPGGVLVEHYLSATELMEAQCGSHQDFRSYGEESYLGEGTVMHWLRRTRADEITRRMEQKEQVERELIVNSLAGLVFGPLKHNREDLLL